MGKTRKLKPPGLVEKLLLEEIIEREALGDVNALYIIGLWAKCRKYLGAIASQRSAEKALERLELRGLIEWKVDDEDNPTVMFIKSTPAGKLSLASWKEWEIGG